MICASLYLPFRLKKHMICGSLSLYLSFEVSSSCLHPGWFEAVCSYTCLSFGVVLFGVPGPMQLHIDVQVLYVVHSASQLHLMLLLC